MIKCSSIVVQETMHNANVVFGVGVFEDESCFQQVLFLLLF
jgi:hypothetical protein